MLLLISELKGDLFVLDNTVEKKENIKPVQQIATTVVF